MVCWLVDCPIGWLFGQLVEMMVGWLVLVGWLVGWLAIHSTVGCFVDWSWFVVCLVVGWAAGCGFQQCTAEGRGAQSQEAEDFLGGHRANIT